VSHVREKHTGAHDSIKTLAGRLQNGRWVLDDGRAQSARSQAPPCRPGCIAVALVRCHPVRQFEMYLLLSSKLLSTLSIHEHELPVQHIWRRFRILCQMVQNDRSAEKRSVYDATGR